MQRPPQPQHPDARFIRLASQGVFIYYFQKKLLCARTQTTRKDEKFGARMAQSAEKAADVGFRNQKWTPERALFNDTNERFQLGRTPEKIDLGDNRQNFD